MQKFNSKFKINWLDPIFEDERALDMKKKLIYIYAKPPTNI